MPQEETVDVLIVSEVMPIVKGLVTARTQSQLTKAVEELYAAYPEVVHEYLEDPQAPGHRFPGPEKDHPKASPHFGYKQGKDGKQAPQSENDKFNTVVKPEVYLKNLVRLIKAFGSQQATLTKLNMRQLVALQALRKAYAAELAKAPIAPPAGGGPAAMQQERRLCPRCGGAPCYCPDGGGQAGKSADGSAGPGSETQKAPTAVTEDRKDFVPQSEPDRPLKNKKT